MIYLQLIFAFLQIGLFSIGGGYAALPMIQDQVVDGYQWITMNEFSDVLTISQMTPGPIAINAATFVGNKVAGILGALCATVGVVLPSFFIVLLLAFLYYKYRNLKAMNAILKGLRVAVVALIASAGITLITQAIFMDGILFATIDYFSLILFIVAFILLVKFKQNPILVMFLCGIIALITQNFI